MYRRFSLRLVTAGSIIFAVFAFGACDAQSGITKKSLEQFHPTPTPPIVIPTPEPIDPADVLKADTSIEGPQLVVSRATDKKDLNCDKYNRVMINGSDHKVTIKGACREIMVNGSGNQVTAAAATEIITNGDGNTVEYSKYVNGIKPIVTDNSHGGNGISKAPTPPAKN